MKNITPHLSRFYLKTAQTLTLFLGFFAAAQSLGAPSAELLKVLGQSYRSEVSTKSVFSGWSLFACRNWETTLRGFDPINGKLRSVYITEYQGINASPSGKTVILLPPTGGVNIFDRGYANELCRKGVNVMLIKYWDGQYTARTDFAIHDEGALRSLVAIRHTVEMLQQRRVQSIGLLGTSVGAMSANLALAYEPRLTTAVLIVGSANFADVITESHEAQATKLRNIRMRELNLLDIEDYRKKVRREVHINPGELIGYSGKKQVMIFTANQDLTVPSVYQKNLVTLWQPQRHIALPGDHITVIKETFWQHRNDIVQFLKSSLQGGIR